MDTPSLADPFWPEDGPGGSCGSSMGIWSLRHVPSATVHPVSNQTAGLRPGGPAQHRPRQSWLAQGLLSRHQGKKGQVGPNGRQGRPPALGLLVHLLTGQPGTQPGVFKVGP